MAFGSHIVTVRRLEKYIDDVIGKKANLPDTSKTIIGNISQINSDLSDKQNKITGVEISVATQLTFNTDIQCGVGSHDLSLSPGYPNPNNIIGCEVISSNISTYSTDLVEAYILNDKKTLRLCHRGSINSAGIANTRVRFYVSA